MYTVSVFVLYHITSFHGLTRWLVSVWDWCVESCQIDWKISRMVLLFDGCILGPSWTPSKKHTVSKKKLLFKELQWIRSEKEAVSEAPTDSQASWSLDWNHLNNTWIMKPSFSFALRSATFWLIPEIVCETVSSTSQRATNLARNVAGYAAMSCSFCEGLRFAHRFWILRKFGRTIQGFIVH